MRLSVGCILLVAVHHVHGFATVAPPSKSPVTGNNGDDGKNEKLKATSKASSSSTERPPSFFKPWPTPKVEALGDYRNEEYLEKHIGGPLYSKQAEMARFPVPTLEETVERLIPTAVPLATSDEEKEAFLEACRNFVTEAKDLQSRLEQRKADTDSNSSWLQQWWQKYAYLTYRDPVAVFVSYFLLVGDDDKVKGNGLARAAAIMVAVAQSRKEVCSGQMPYESVSQNKEEVPLCSTSFKYLFHGCRIPTPVSDKYHIYDPSMHKHCIVASRGQFYAVDFVDDNDEPLSLALLEARLKRVQELSATAADEYPQLGWLTSSDRDTWAEKRQELIDVGGGTMDQALEKLESGAFVLNLDQDEPETLTEACNVFWHGGDISGANRWMDKSMQILCSKNGKVAYLGEHSMSDAAPTISTIRRILKSTYSRLEKKLTDEDKAFTPEDVDAGITNVFEECWTTDPSVLAAATKLAAEAKERHYKLTHDYELKTVQFDGYGKKFVKQADFNGPEYAQMAIQLAAYRLFDKSLVGTYEAALARYFLHGRTETARPVSPDTLAFCQAMDNDATSKEEKLNLLKKAAATFVEFQNNASSGKGIDRHLFGLSCALSEDDSSDKVTPALFNDPLYQRAKKFRLSTSSVIFCPGFGPVADDGLGIGFNVEKDSFLYICTSRKENDYVPKFTQLLEEALVEMGELIKE